MTEKLKILFLLFFMILLLKGYSQKLTIEINGLRSNMGQILLDVYKDKQSYSKETPFKTYEFKKDKVKDGHLTLTINDLKTGTYAIALIDDENSNHKIDFKFFLPKEGLAFSNFPFSEMKKPDFNSFAFLLDSENTIIKFRVRYFMK